MLEVVKDRKPLGAVDRNQQHMPWFGMAAKERTAGTAPTPASLESSTVLRARGTPEANAVIEQLNAEEARVRSVVAFRQGDVLSFEYVAGGVAPIPLRGRVVGQTASCARITYRLTLDSTSAEVREQLARALSPARRVPQREEEGVAPHVADGLRRASARADAQFGVQYRSSKDGFKAGQAANVSSGGLSMACGASLGEGATVDLRFTLPSEVLQALPEETVTYEMRGQHVQRKVYTGARRAFETIEVRARVVNKRAVMPGVYAYGLAFLGIHAVDREQIARYVRAVQLIKRG